MAIYQCELELVNKHGNTNFENLCFDSIEQTLKRYKSWSSNIIQYGRIDDTCVEVFCEQKTIREISIRINLMSITPKELDSIISFMNLNNLHIIKNNNIVTATRKVLTDIMKESMAFKYLSDTNKYLENQLGDGSLIDNSPDS